YAHDFFEPENVLNLERAMKLWNAKHDEVKIKIANSPEFFKYIEGKYGSQIPTYRGEWSGLWSEAKTASPRISATGRYTHDHAPAAETLWSAIAMTRKLPVPVGNFAEVYDLMFTYDEHSGAGNTGWPQLNSSEPLRAQNREYVELTRHAKDETDTLLRTGIGILSDPSRFDDRGPDATENTGPVVIYNGLSWPRTDVVRLASPAADRKIIAIRDAAGSMIPFDTDDEGNVIFIAKNVPSMGYATYDVATAPGRATSTLRPVAGSSSVENARFVVALNVGGTIRSMRDKSENRELVNPNGERPFNDLLRVEGPDASRVTYPVKARIQIRKGIQMSEVSVYRERSSFPYTRIAIYDGIDRVEIHNELDPTKMPFVGGNNNWHDSYYFAFPFNVSKDGLKVMRGGQRWFDRLPDDYLPGARKDSVSTQHLIGLTDGKSSALIAHRQAFHWVYSGFISTKVRPQGAPADFPALYTGKFPLPEATIYSRAVREGSQADTHDLGILNVPTVEPGREDRMVFEYAVAGDGAFDPVQAWRMGSDFNMPLRAQYVGVAPQERSRGFFSLDQTNVEIVTVKAITESAFRGEVTSAPLSPKVNKIFIVRLQEFAGRATNVTVSLPAKLTAASLMNITESVELKKIGDLSPLRVSLRPYECATVRIEIE
ncbi:MAG: glycosyl hydrolase-related protein, partial [Pyrinomonadaceae bacterium]